MSQSPADSAADGPIGPVPADRRPDLPVDPDVVGPPPPPAPVRQIVLGAVLVGGFIGTLGRYELDLAWPTPLGHFPLSTFVINTSGCLLLGFVLTVILQRARHTRYLRPFLGTGVLGGWTTYSTFAVEVTLLAKDHDLATAGAYLGATLVCGLAAIVAGMVLGRLWPLHPYRPLGAPA